MQVTCDDVWASPSTLHVRVTVHADDGRWRQRFYSAVPLDSIPEEAITSIIAHYLDAKPEEDYEQDALF